MGEELGEKGRWQRELATHKESAMSFPFRREVAAENRQIVCVCEPTTTELPIKQNLERPPFLFPLSVVPSSRTIIAHTCRKERKDAQGTKRPTTTRTTYTSESKQGKKKKMVMVMTDGSSCIIFLFCFLFCHFCLLFCPFQSLADAAAVSSFLPRW